MAGKFSGRVFAGEDSEEESEEESEIQYNFQFSSLAAPAPTAAVAAPRFSVPTPVSAGGEDSEEGESDEDALPPPISTAPKAIVTAPVAAGGEDSEEDDDDDGEGAQAFVGLKQSASSETRSAESRSPAAQQTAVTPTAKVTTAAATAAGRAVVTPPPAAPQLRLPEQPQKHGIEDDDAHWRLGDGIDGVHVMGDAIVTRLQPSLDDSITRIAELTESQQELLQLLASQHAGICANEQIKKVAVVMDKLPHYIRKIQDIKTAMAEISASVEKMKKRGESLRVDAQSHALKKESKRDSMAQWNKLHAARSSEQQSAK